MIGDMGHSTLLPRIARLPSALANQIAAGEVIERPASVIKELVENSLDAGAQRIVIDVRRGGLESMRVTDDGHGIHPDDLELALERHATSKIHSQADLDGISSLGFRGEALPSIASVAGVRVCSRAADAAHAFAVESEPGGDAPRRRPASHPIGTTVEVRGLFHGLPARRKFLRSERTEYLHLLDIIQRLALSRPGVAFTFSHNGASVLQCPAGVHGEEHTVAILGRAFQRDAETVERMAGGMRLWGWVGGPEQTRSQSDRQYLFLNGRTIRDRLLSHAIRTGLDDGVPSGRFPVYVLHLELDARAADVNVHPTKHEVRFRNARDVHDFICATLRDVRGRAMYERPRYASGPAQTSGMDSSVPGAHGVAGAVRITTGAAGPGMHMRVAEADPQPRLGRPIAQLGGEFLLTERDSRWLLIDLHAVRRLDAEMRLRRQLDSGGIIRRPLLVPVELELSATDTAVVEECSGLLGEFGLRLEPVAPTRIAVRDIPAVLPQVDATRLALDVVELLRRGREEGDLKDAIIEVMAHQAAAPPGESPALEALTPLLGSLEDLGLDVEAGECPGLWRTLDRQDLLRLLRARG